MKLIIGLGNPGKQYEKTRHNVGFMVVDALRKKLANFNINNWELSKKFNAEICGCTINGEKIVLVKPMTFMNASGLSVALIMQYYKVLPPDLLLINDDKDILLGKFKIQTNHSHAGHHGVRSTIENIGSKNFTRVRIGIATQNAKKMEDVAKFVLNKFGVLERKTLNMVIEDAAEKIIEMIN